MRASTLHLREEVPRYLGLVVGTTHCHRKLTSFTQRRLKALMMLDVPRLGVSRCHRSQHCHVPVSQSVSRTVSQLDNNKLITDIWKYFI